MTNYKTIKDDIEKTIEEANKVQKETQEKVTETILENIRKEYEQLSTKNLEQFQELTKTAKKIEKINFDILKTFLNENDFKEFKKEGQIHFTLDIKLNENQKEQINQFNGKFISEKILMTLPYLLEGNITKGSELEKFKEDFDYLTKQSEKRKVLLDKYYQLYEDIENTNREIGKIRDEILDQLPHTEAFSGDTDKKMIDLSDEKVFDKFASLMNIRGDIEGLTLFEYSQRVESQYCVSFNYDEEKNLLEYTFKKDLNLSQKYLDISNPRIKQMQEELEQLKKENAILKNEEPEEIKDFKPTPIEKQISFNDKLSQNLSTLENNQVIEIGKTGGKGKKVKDSIMNVYIENGEMTTTKVLEPFDRVVLQTIYSLIQKNKTFDIQMLKETMSGNKNRHKGNLDEDIEKSINKLRTTLIQIEIPQEIQSQLKQPFEKIGIKDNILPLREFYAIKGGHKKSVFGFTSKSIYYEYEEARGQLITKNNKLLQGGIGNATKQSIVLTDYISDRIEDMKHQKEKNKNHSYIEEIKLDKIWILIITEDDLKLSEKSLANKKSRYKNQIKTILSTYKKDKYIKNFEEYSEGFKIKL